MPNFAASCLLFPTDATAPLALQRFRLGAHSVRVVVPVQGVMEITRSSGERNMPPDPPGSNSVFGNLQG